MGFEFARGMREKVRGEYRISPLMKQKNKGKICFVVHIAGKKKLLFYIYAVIVKQKIYKRSTNHYCPQAMNRVKGYLFKNIFSNLYGSVTDP